MNIEYIKAVIHNLWVSHWKDVLNQIVFTGKCKNVNCSLSTSESSILAHFHFMKRCQTVCNFILSFCSVWLIPILITQYFSQWLSLFSSFFCWYKCELVHSHHCPLLYWIYSCWSTLPSSVSPQHSDSIW